MESITENAVLLYGPRKSGSTLLQYLLDGNKKYIMIPGELKLKRLYYFDGFSEEEKYATYTRFSKSFLFKMRLNNSEGGIEKDFFDAVFGASRDPKQISSEKSGFYPEKYFDCLNINLKGKNYALKQYIEADIKCIQSSFVPEKVDARGWMAKEVGGDNKVVSNFRYMFPFSKFIFIKRDNLYIVRSIILDRKRKGKRLTSFKILREWKEASRVNRFVEKQKGKSDSICIQYEKLVKSPEEETFKISKFLGIEWDKFLTQPSLLGINTVVSTSSKNEARVFSSSDKNWKEGLSFREAAILKTCQLLAFLRFPLFRK